MADGIRDSCVVVEPTTNSFVQDLLVAIVNYDS